MGASVVTAARYRFATPKRQVLGCRYLYGFGRVNRGNGETATDNFLLGIAMSMARCCSTATETFPPAGSDSIMVSV